MNKQLKTIAIILCIVLATVGIVYAVTQIWSNPVTVTPQPTPTPTPTPTPPPTPTLTLTVNTTTPYVGENITLTAVLSNGASGVLVHFYNINTNTEIGSSTTVSGVATFIKLMGNTDVKVYNATCTV